MLEAQQTLFEVERRLVEATFDYHRALAEVEGLTTHPSEPPTETNKGATP